VDGGGSMVEEVGVGKGSPVELRLFVLKIKAYLLSKLGHSLLAVNA
jgi:hypothetical protein